MSIPSTFPAFMVDKADSSDAADASDAAVGADGEVRLDSTAKPNSSDKSASTVATKIAHVDLSSITGPADVPNVTIRVSYSAINYKDALAVSGHPGVTKKFPHVPGIDAVGTVVTSTDDRFSVGAEVFVAHAKFGTSEFGGWSSFINVPGDWVYDLPPKMTARDVVIWGTAGFTAAQSVEQLVARQIAPDAGPIVVSGATGGVGIFAVKLLHKLSYQVVASTGKMERRDWLMGQGATEVIHRDELNDSSSAPLLKGRWAGAIDTVGGNTLTTLLRSVQGQGCVTACGLVAGHEISMTVYPFILRGVSLCGIDSANISRQTRISLWEKIAADWQLDDLSELAHEISLAEIPAMVDRILAGKIVGRTVIQVNPTS